MKKGNQRGKEQGIGDQLPVLENLFTSWVHVYIDTFTVFKIYSLWNYSRSINIKAISVVGFYLNLSLFFTGFHTV